jgi:hypothetical protein
MVWLPFLAVLPVVGFGGIALYADAIDKKSVLAVGLLVAGGAFLAGGLLGFLFGIPRSIGGAETEATDATRRARYLPNTNLEQISDWLEP